MRIAFFGTPFFAVPTLDRLLASRHSIVGVVTQPDRPRDRGQHVTASPVKAAALAHGVPVLQPDRLKAPDVLGAFAAWSADLGVVAAYGKILPEELLRVPRLGLINVHASLLPRWRGAAPVERAVIAGDTTTGVTIMRIVRQLDAGPTFASVTRAIAPDETAEQVERDLATLGADLLVEVVEQLADGRARETPQDDTRATYAPRLTKEEGLVDWSEPAVAIHNKVRGLHPWPHAFSFLHGARHIILRTSTGPHEGAALPDSGATVAIDPTPGTVVAASGDQLAVSTGGGGAIRIVEIQPEGRRAMDARRFLSGHRVEVGARFESSARPQ
jgi:methionyl-tRNA formyltransferase